MLFDGDLFAFPARTFRRGEVFQASVDESAQALEDLNAGGAEMALSLFRRTEPAEQFGQGWPGALAEARGGRAS